MKILFLDLASHPSDVAQGGTIACVTESSVPAHVSVDHRIGDDALLPLAEDCLRRAGWKLSDLTHVACVTGPGGFTSLRVGVAAANALSYALKIPSCGIHLSDLFESRVMSDESSVWLHSTKKTHLFVRGFGAAKDAASEAVCLTLDAAKAILKPEWSWMGELIPEHRTLVESAGLSPAALKPLADMLPDFLSAQTYSLQTLEPWYGREW